MPTPAARPSPPACAAVPCSPARSCRARCPAPSSACTLAGSNSANPHPAAISCHVFGRSPSSFIFGKSNGVAFTGCHAGCCAKHFFERRVLLNEHRFPRRLMRSNSSLDGSFGAGNPARPNIISTGTGPFAFAGVTSVMWMRTLIAGNDELSTSPDQVLGDHRRKADHLMIDRRSPSTSPWAHSAARAHTHTFENISTISGRRLFHHISGVITFCPSFIVSGSGIFGNGLACDSS